MEFLPELSPCASLRQLTLANVRVKANACMDQVRVVNSPPPLVNALLSLVNSPPPLVYILLA